MSGHTDSPAPIAFFAAVAASVGDLLLLYAGNASRAELGIAPPPDAVVWLGAALGVVGVPCYALGYRAAARRSVPTSPVGARSIAMGGAIGAIAGAAIHALTALAIDAGRRAGATAPPPLEAVAASGRLLLSLWSLTALAFGVASLAFAYSQWRVGSAAARWLACANPLALTLVLAAVAAPSEWLRSFVTPAAPNLAHVLFFYALWRAPDRAA